MFLLVLLVLLFIQKTNYTFAISSPVPVVTINNISDNSLAGNNFSLDFTINNLQIGDSFYYKIFGGVSDNTSSVQTFHNSNYLNYTSSWVDFPTIAAGDTNPITITAIGRVNNSIGTNNIRIRIAKISNTSSKYDSESKIIDIIAPTPTLVPTLVPTSIPTSIPSVTQVPTRVPTSVPTNTPLPTKIIITPTTFISPTITISPSIEPTIISEPSVLGIEITLAENISGPKKPKKISFAVILMISGGLLLLSPLLVSKLQRQKNK